MAFSFPGILIVAVILLPNLLFILFPPKNTPGTLKDGGIWINILEHGGRILFFALFILSPFDPDRSRNPVFFVLMILCAGLYYLLWLRYMGKDRQFSTLFDTVLGIPVPMAVFPILSFTFAAIWLHAWLALIPLTFFAIGHVYNSQISARQIIS